MYVNVFDKYEMSKIRSVLIDKVITTLEPDPDLILESVDVWAIVDFNICTVTSHICLHVPTYLLLLC